jgi:hypothetical protein
MRALKQGRVEVAGGHGSYFTLSTDIVRLASCFYREGLVKFVGNPLDWRRQIMLAGSMLSLPLVGVALVGAVVYLIMEERFNRSLLFDLVAKPASRAFEVV